MKNSKTLSLVMATILTLGTSTSAFAGISAQKPFTKISAYTQSKKQVIVSKQKSIDIATKMLKMIDTDMKIEQSKRNLKLSATLNSKANKNEWNVQWKDSKGNCFANVIIDAETGIVHSCSSSKYKLQGKTSKLSSQDINKLKKNALEFLISYHGNNAKKDIITSTTNYNKSGKSETFNVDFKLKDNSKFSVIFDSTTKKIISVLM